jgi:hypothetical protein
MKEENNGRGAPDAANGAIGVCVQEKVKTGLSISAVTVSTTGEICITFLSNYSFQSDQTCYYVYIFQSKQFIFLVL